MRVEQIQNIPPVRAMQITFSIPLFSNQSSLSCLSTTGLTSGCTFNDITRGNNSVPCTPYYSGATDYTFGCSTTVDGANGVLEAQNLDTGGPVNGLYGFDAAAGPDLATGLGSINAFNLVSNWSGVVGNFVPTATTLCMSASTLLTTQTSCSVPSNAPITITHGTRVYVNIAVNGAVSGTPIPVTENFTIAPPSTTLMSEDVALIGTFSSEGFQAAAIPGCTTGAVDRFHLDGVAPPNAANEICCPQLRNLNCGFVSVSPMAYSHRQRPRRLPT